MSSPKEGGAVLARHAARVRRFLNDKLPSWREQLPCSDVLQHDRRALAGHLGIVDHPATLARVIHALTQQHVTPATAGTRR